jgi:hypothetical protein
MVAITVTTIGMVIIITAITIITTTEEAEEVLLIMVMLQIAVTLIIDMVTTEVRQLITQVAETIHSQVNKTHEVPITTPEQILRAPAILMGLPEALPIKVHQHLELTLELNHHL